VESVPQKGSTFSIRINIGQVDDASFSSFTNLRHQMIEQEGRDAGALPLLTGMKVLVCEDVSDNFRLIKYFLEPNQVALDWAPDGKSGIAKALQTTYDLILMDIQMPCMDGYEATRHLPENGYRGPIIALTGHAMREETDRCLAAGCDDHLTKPIDQNELLATLVKYTQTSMNAPPKEENFRQYIDCDAETLPVMQNFLKRKYPKHLLELETSVAKGDWQRVGDIAHQLKGSIGVFFDERVGTLSARIELEAKRQKPDMNELASLVSQLNDLDLPQHAG
jgi:CheY-like chemotaxis protein/HPt (histidine-containing phosphotransfer) domain-containing protein